MFARYSLTTIVRATKVTPRHTPIRTLHTPFEQLHVRKTEAQTTPLTYEKQYDFSYEPLAISYGDHTYVVSQPDTTVRHYEVPCGAYPISSPYQVSLCLEVVPTGIDDESSSDSMCNNLRCCSCIPVYYLVYCKEAHWSV